MCDGLEKMSKLGGTGQAGILMCHFKETTGSTHPRVIPSIRSPSMTDGRFGGRNSELADGDRRIGSQSINLAVYELVLEIMGTPWSDSA